jgi:hypothetical protein
MNKFDTLLRSCASGLAVTLLMISFALNLISGEKTYLSKSEEEVQILSLVLADEIKTNNLAPSGTICFSIGGLDPDPSLVKSIRRRGLKVRGSAEWSKKFNCGFEVQMEYAHFDLSESVKIRSKVMDLREINTGRVTLQ